MHSHEGLDTLRQVTLPERGAGPLVRSPELLDESGAQEAIEANSKINLLL